MTKSDTSTSDIFAPMKSASEVFAANPLMGPQVRHFWQAQDRMLDEAQKFSSAWFKRRHDAAQTALRASEEIASNGSGDPSAAMKVMADWQTHSMERLAEDARDCMEMMTRCAGLAVTNEAEAVADSVEATKKATKTSMSEPV